MKETILFSNVIGDLTSKDEDCSFNPNLICALRASNCENSNLVFIHAPNLKNQDLYFEKILQCFNKIGINFNQTLEIYDMSKVDELAQFPKNRVYFLMCGNPLTQYELIEKYNLVEELRNYDGLVIGFCAGAINLSKHAIITTDSDFDKPISYNGINRIDFSVEPHFYLDDTEFTKNRLQEINNFCKTLNTEIYAIPEKSVIDILNDSIGFYGEIYKYQ